jgi:hypothetical protein
MMLYVNGDSHSQGVNVQANESFATKVAKEFRLDIVNEAQSGASNARILRTSKEYLATRPNPDLIIIGWSTWEREEWQHGNQYYNVNSSGHDLLPKTLENSYKKWVIEQTPDHVDAKSRQIHEEIFDLHLLLQQQRISHLFFNCMYNFFGIPPDQKKDWNNCYIDPYDNDASYYWWLTQQGYQADAWYHFGADGHRAWANRLISHIQEHNLV